MQEELLQFKLQQVWTLVGLPHGKRAIGTKWVYRNKKDKRGIVIRNKARLVAQGHTQEEGIDYDEVFAPVPRIEAIRLFLVYASYKDFVVYQMDVKSAFLYGKIEKEVYVCQPPGFEDPNFPDRVYVDDMIFGSTKKKLCTEFEKMMHKNFQMSSMGELTFFLGLQVKQKEDGIFISQDKYVTEILKKFSFSDVKTASTPMETHKPLLKDADGEDIDECMYRSMIGSLMYLTSSRPDIMFTVCVCARFQVNPKVLHLHAVKRIFRYLKGQPKLGLWYPKDSPFDLVAYTDSDYAGASLDKKSTTGGIGVNAGDSKLMLLGINLLLLGKDNAVRHNLQLLVNVKTVNGEQQKKIIITEATVRRDLQLEDANGGSLTLLSEAYISETDTAIGDDRRAKLVAVFETRTESKAERRKGSQEHQNEKIFKSSEIREEESSSKRAGDELEQEPIKKQKVDDDKEREDLQQCFKLVTEKMLQLMIQLLKEFDREDLENLWKLVKAKHGDTRPEEGYERVLWGDLKTMFEHHIEDEVWRSLQGKKVLLWRLYESYGVHFVRFEDMHVYMLVEKRYPLTPTTITDMLNKKLKSAY
ncbi:putative ribonuclease H-like domain-containing protein [Tanacetum coccineum]|uniref:Ribonuclease H-like domain-containing protein n=1 Tax=Tanacetum coccineum TaxID=301880 RepID=A0ABQ5IMY4_9ASTR